MLRSFFVLFLCVILTGIALPHAASADTIAIVNVQKILHDSLAAQSARDQLKAKQQQFQDQIKAKETELKKEEQELTKQKSLLAPDAFEQKASAFRGKAANMQKDVNDKSIQLKKAFEMALSKLQESIVEIITGMAKEKNFTVAVPSTQTLYYQPSLDITDEVLARLNKKLTKININFQQQ